jgi:glycosyltransferase involved in cell wall biosynthesis
MISAGTSIEEGEGGAGGYYANLLPGLCADPRLAAVIVYAPDWYEPARRWGHAKLELRPCPVPRSRAARVLYEQFGIPVHARRDRVDVLLSLANVRPLVRRAPNVLVLHAVQHFLFGGSIGAMRSAYLRIAVPRSARTAHRVLTVSETLRRDALRLFDLDPSSVVTVRMGPPPVVDELLASSGTAERYRTPGGAPYVLCISRLYEHKNHRRLIDAFARAAAPGDLAHQLLVVGGDAEVTSAELAEHAAAAGVAERVKFLGRVPQSMVAGLYAGAAMVAYVSLYETFGLPVLETFASGRPLLTSAHGATPEIAGDGALCVDPTDVEAIATGLRSILLDEDLRARLVTAGRARLAEFSWERCARETVDAVVQVSGHPQARGGPA